MKAMWENGLCNHWTFTIQWYAWICLWLVFEKKDASEYQKCIQKHILPNKLRARRPFYIEENKRNEKMLLSYTNRVHRYGPDHKSMGVDSDREELFMAILNGLPS